MHVAFFSTKAYDRRFFSEAKASGAHSVAFLEPRLSVETAALARGFAGVCAFVNDQLDATVLEILAAGGTQLVALRSAGYNHVDLPAAERLGLTVVHVPQYSPHAVAEHTVALMLALNRHIHRAYNRVREGNFSIEGLLGFDLKGKSVGVVGAGRIGLCVAQILQGFQCQVRLSDPNPSDAARATGIPFCTFAEILAQSQVITLHCPLVPATRHLINPASIARMQRGAMLINTSRGALVDTPAAIDGLLSGQLGYLGIDVYEEEAGLFYEDHSNTILGDAVFSRLLTLPNVLITGHQAFFTSEALTTIAETTLASLSAFEAGQRCEFALVTPPVRRSTTTPPQSPA